MNAAVNAVTAGAVTAIAVAALLGAIRYAAKGRTRERGIR